MKNINLKLLKRLLKIFFVSTSLGLFLYFYLYFGEKGKLPPLIKDLPNLLFITGISFIHGFLLFYFNLFLINSKYLKNKNFARILSAIIFNYLFIILISFIIVKFYVFTYTSETYSDFHNQHTGSIFRYYILSFLTIFLFALVDFLIRSYQKFEQAKVMAAELSRERSELQLEAFKSQLSPHFLFNNLNTLSHLIYQNPKTNENYIRNLSKTYDYILTNSKKDLVTFNEELDFINAYSYLLNIRYQDSLSISINIAEVKKQRYLPPLSLQLLLENAVKHNVAEPDNKLNIEINQFGEYIEVKNNILTKPNNLHSLKLGLKNLKKRYSFFTDMPVKITENKYFKVRIPLIISNVS